MRYFIYCRKSSESEDRQILSIDSQRDELERAFGSRQDMKIIEVFKESFSAKAPGRPIFSEMLARIERGDADGIIAWHPDRLARNSIDGGRIIYLLDKNILKDLRFSTFSFENYSQGKFMLSIIFGYSKYYVDSLSENVKRGNRAKLQRGWLPNAPPIGYLNERSNKTIVADPDRFPLVRRLFELALSGNYSLQALQEQTNKWGLRTVQRKRLGGRYLCISTIHSVLRNPFYTGRILWNGETYKGSHPPLITIDEFQRLQGLLRRPGKPTPKKHSFPFTGLIRCGECGAMVTAEEKVNRYGTHYTYYHCSKRRFDYRCRQPSINGDSLDRTLKEALRRIAIPEKLHRWVVEEIGTATLYREEEKTKQASALESAHKESTRALENLVTLRIRDVIDDAEFTRQRQALQDEQANLQEQMGLARDGHQWFEPARKLFSFSYRAMSWYLEGDDQRKRHIVRAVGSNLTLTNKNLSIQARKPFSGFSGKPSRSNLSAALEDVRTLYNNRDPELMETLAIIDDLVRTYDLSLNENLETA